MGLETGTYIDSLNAANPVGAVDPKSEGADHLKLIKSTILNTLPNLTGAVTATHTELNLMDGVTATTNKLNYVDVTTAGTAQASKAMVLDASKGITGITSLTGTTLNASTTLQIGGVSLTASVAELNYVNGVTSAIQTQIDGKQPLDANLTALAALANTNSNFIVGNGTAWVAESGATARASLGVDPAGMDNSTDVTLAGTGTHRSLSGQVLTINKINLTSNTDVTGSLPNGSVAGLGSLATLNSVTATQIAASAVGQIHMAASAIGQGELSTATVSLAGSVLGTAGTNVDIALTAYCFFPMIHNTQLSSSAPIVLTGHSVDAANADSPRFRFTRFATSKSGADTYDVDYRYIQA